MAAPTWESLWERLEVLEKHARHLRRLSQEEPLLQARPDYPQPLRPRRSRAGELRQLLDTLSRTLADVLEGLPGALPSAQAPAGVLPDEAPQVMARRLTALARITRALQEEAFQPPPPLPQHAPPYLADAPRHGLVGSKAVLLSYGIEETVASLRNALLATANTAAGSGHQAAS